MLLLLCAFNAAANCTLGPSGGPSDEAAINACLARGGVVTLNPGTYNIANKGIYVGVDGTTLRSADPANPARLRAVPGMQYPLVVVRDRRGVTIDSVVLDGNKESDPTAARRRFCGRRDGVDFDQYRPYNLRILNSRDILVTGITSMNAPCGTGLEIAATNFTIQRSTVKSNGSNTGPNDRNYVWADGITVLRCNGGKVIDNIIEDNTDVDLIVGGIGTGLANSCTVTGNRIAHREQYAFAGLMLEHFNDGGGIFGTSRFANNTITNHRAPGDGIGFGIMVGHHAWAVGCSGPCPYDVTGGIIEANTVTGAYINLAVDGVRNTIIRNNTLSAPAGTTLAWAVQPLCFKTSTTPAKPPRPLNYTAAHHDGGTVPPGGEVWAFDNDDCVNLAPGCTAQCCSATECDDGDPCTLDSCFNGVCRYAQRPGPLCNDGFRRSGR
ncbi:MAG TPA: right-handed parallel beta-helix repeat-containing protein [Thermoanaerobaculia bacterium]